MTNIENTAPEALAAHQMDHEAPHRVPSLMGGIVSGSLIALQLNPLTNEGARIGAFASTLAATGSSQAAAAMFAATTFAIEGSASVATARLLDTPRGEWFMGKIRNFLGKVGLAQSCDTNIGVDSAIALVAGAPAATAFRHMRDPERTNRQDTRFALLASGGIATVTGAQSYLVAEGISQPSANTVGAALLGAGVLVGGYKFAKRYVATKAPIGHEAYRCVVQAADNGPQLTGLNAKDYSRATEDSRTRSVPMQHESGRRQWPALTPIDNNTEFVRGYFGRRYGSETPIYYLSLPPKDSFSSRRVAAKFDKKLTKHLTDVLNEGGMVVFDELEGVGTAEYLEGLLQKTELPGSLHFDTFVDPKNGSSAQSIHYETKMVAVSEIASQREAQPYSIEAVRRAFDRRVANGEIDQEGVSRTILLSPEEMHDPCLDDESRTNVERLWEIYNGQFDRLTKNNPSRGAQTYEELETMLTDEGTVTFAHVDNNKVVAFMMFVSNVEACDWLNKEFYRKRFPGETLIYVPGIARDKNVKGGRYAFDILNTGARVVTDVVNEARLVWQCTNISKDYIPRIVQYGINGSGVARVDEPREMATYSYVGVKLRREVT